MSAWGKIAKIGAECIIGVAVEELVGVGTDKLLQGTSGYTKIAARIGGACLGTYLGSKVGEGLVNDACEDVSAIKTAIQRKKNGGKFFDLNDDVVLGIDFSHSVDLEEDLKE